MQILVHETPMKLHVCHWYICWNPSKFFLLIVFCTVLVYLMHTLGYHLCCEFQYFLTSSFCLPRHWNLASHPSSATDLCYAQFPCESLICSHCCRSSGNPHQLDITIRILWGSFQGNLFQMNKIHYWMLLLFVSPILDDPFSTPGAFSVQVHNLLPVLQRVFQDL